MAITGFKTHSVGKIYFLLVRNMYLEAHEKHLKDQSRATRIFVSTYFFLYVIIYSPLLLFKVWKEKKEINIALEKKHKENVFEVLFDIKKIFPGLSDENASFFSNGLAYGFTAFFLTELFPKFQKVSEKLFENGWFINNYFSIAIKDDPDELIYTDSFNIDILKNNIKEIERLAISRFPRRSEYLKLAFRHQKSGDYISSISVLLPQIDGIFRELTTKELFSKAEKRNSGSWLYALEKSGKESLLHNVLSPLKRNEYFGANFSEALENPKFLSRNRILHGEDLELNDEAKSYKAVSLLFYIVSIVYDAVNEDISNPRLQDYFNRLEELKKKL